MSDQFRAGVYFKEATRPIAVANFFKTVGHTRLDNTPGPQQGKQTYWFPSVALFNREIVGIIESLGKGAMHFPIPVFQPVAAEPVAEVSQSLGSAEVEHQTHNLEVAGSTPAPATTDEAPSESAETLEPDAQEEAEEVESADEAPAAPAKNKGGRPKKNK